MPISSASGRRRDDGPGDARAAALMCGIAGRLLYHADSVDRELAGLARMIAPLRHRGPDDEGLWSDGTVSLGSRRLAIIDLTTRGRQPIANEDGTVRIVMNGEIYNFEELRKRLSRAGHTFRSDTDTETVVHLYEEEGIECLTHLRGMFAFAIWDARRRLLFVARDRLGKKPLWYHADHDGFLFASEPKALLQDKAVHAEVEPTAIHHYLTYGYVPHPLSAFRSLRKLPPAHYLLVRDGQVTTHRYWSLRYGMKRTQTEDALGEELVERLGEAVRLRLIADVPLGALLSGGVDSSVIVALMRRFSSKPVRTFSIRFDDTAYDESRYARDVATRFETEHHETVVKPDAIALLPRLVWHYDEPFADSSALPSMALSAMARDFVTVALSGDGGDESFLGYDRYVAADAARWLEFIPAPARLTAASIARALPAGPPKSLRERSRRFASALALPGRRRYGSWMSVFDEPAKRALYSNDFAATVGDVESFAILDAAYAASDATSIAEASAHADIQTYLPDDLLVKMDIASMAASLEVRSPFLDHEIVEFAASLPANMKLRGRTQKYLLKRVMSGVLPAEIMHRPKMGFAVPLERWFRHDLRELAYDVLLGTRAVQRGWFRGETVRRMLDDHVAGRAYHHPRLWALLVLELWHRTFIDGPRPAPAPVDWSVLR
jgi:asparagine synthase (glutamine-hydrolysing)